MLEGEPVVDLWGGIAHPASHTPFASTGSMISMLSKTSNVRA
jgi:hypothetical protein